MSHELKEGVKLKGITGPEGTSGWLWLTVGKQPHHCSEIVVYWQITDMSGGQETGCKLFARAVRNNGEVVLVNLYHMESVTLLEEE